MSRDRVRPPQPARNAPGKWTSLALAIVVNVAFVAVLVFTVSWRNPRPEAVTAELYAPPAKSAPAPAPAVEPPPSVEMIRGDKRSVETVK